MYQKRPFKKEHDELEGENLFLGLKCGYLVAFAIGTKNCVLLMCIEAMKMMELRVVKYISMLLGSITMCLFAIFTATMFSWCWAGNADTCRQSPRRTRVASGIQSSSPASS